MNNISQQRVKLELQGMGNVKFKWIKAHVGHWGNESADEATKKACQLSPNVQLERAVCTIKKEVNTLINNEWNSKWESLSWEWQSKLFCKGPLDIRIGELERLGRYRMGTLIRFLSGHAFMNRHNYIMGLAESGKCRLCDTMEEETPEHIITRCPILNNWRFEKFGTFEVFDYTKIGYGAISDFITHYLIYDLEANNI